MPLVKKNENIYDGIDGKSVGFMSKVEEKIVKIKKKAEMSD